VLRLAARAAIAPARRPVLRRLPCTRPTARCEGPLRRAR